MQRKISLFCLLLALLLPLSACRGQERAPRDMLADFCASYSSMPAGQCYYSGTAEWETGFLSPALADSLFLEDNGENAFSLCREYAIFLSTTFSGGEIAFLQCAGQDDAVRVAAMCTARIARVRQVQPGAAITENACVLRRGKTVILLLMPDNAQAREICERLL